MATHVQPSLLVRLAACAVLTAAPAAIALGTATISHADAGDSLVATPTHHEAFPGQNPQTDRPWYQTPRHDNKPEADNSDETPVGQLVEESREQLVEESRQLVLESLGLGNLGQLADLANLGRGGRGGLGGLGRK
jgi:hypothetical protein